MKIKKKTVFYINILYKYLLIKKTFFEINYTGRKSIFRQIKSVNFINFSQSLRVILPPAVKDESPCIFTTARCILTHVNISILIVPLYI
jgi:hypothetical protein